MTNDKGNGASAASTGGAKKFHMRGFTSLLVFFSFLAMVFAGVMLYLSPKGRVAHWTAWTLCGLGKEEWSAVHMVASLLFFIGCLFHLYFNWTLFWGYIKSRAKASLNLKREMALAVVITLVCVAGTILNVAPFSLVPGGNASMQDYWEARSARAPVPHAEEFTLTQLAEEIGQPVETLAARLEAAGVTVPGPTAKVGDLAREHGMTPSQLFAIVQPGQQGAGRGGGRGQGGGGQGGGGQGAGRQGQQGADDHGAGGQGHGAGRGAGGTGFGRMTVGQVCEKEGLPIETGLQRLSSAGIQADASAVLKDLAGPAGKTPRDIAGIITGQ